MPSARAQCAFATSVIARWSNPWAAERCARPDDATGLTKLTGASWNLCVFFAIFESRLMHPAIVVRTATFPQVRHRSAVDAHQPAEQSEDQPGPESARTRPAARRQQSRQTGS